MDLKDQQLWIEQARRLKRSPKGGQLAPHKPVLLLTLCDLAATGKLTQDTVSLHDIDFVETFLAYWGVVRKAWAQVGQQTDRPQMRLPMYHIQTEGFCEPLNDVGQRANTPETTVGVRLQRGFFSLLQQSSFQQHFTNALIDSQFPDDPEVQDALRIVARSVGSEDMILRVAEEPDRLDFRRYARDRRFRLDVVSAYDHTCALTGVRLITRAATSLVDAAHIRNFSETWDNSVGNGIALAKNAHWTFDAFLWTITDNYTVAVAPDAAFTESGPEAHLIRPLAGKKLILPKNIRAWPSRDALRWHATKFERHWKSSGP